MPEKTPSTRRRWFRYSLRTLLIVVTVLCIFLGMFVKKQRDRHVAIEKIKSWGGIVEFVEFRPKSPADEMSRVEAIFEAHRAGAERPVFPNEMPQGKAWLRWLFGEYFGSQALRISLTRTVFVPEDAVFDLQSLAPLSELRRLSLGGKDIHDDTLRRLPRLPNLESLNLMTGTNVGDDGMECLSRLPNLAHLQVMYGSFQKRGWPT